MVHTITITLPFNAKVVDLLEFATVATETLGPNAVIRVSHFAGDQREPSYTTITASAR